MPSPTPKSVLEKFDCKNAIAFEHPGYPEAAAEYLRVYEGD